MHSDRCHRGHQFTPENTYFNPSRPGVRHCRECRDLHHQVRAIKRRMAAMLKKAAA